MDAKFKKLNKNNLSHAIFAEICNTLNHIPCILVEILDVFQNHILIALKRKLNIYTICIHKNIFVYVFM